MEFPPPPYGGKVHEAGTGPKNRNRAQKQLIWLSEKKTWVQHKYMQVEKKYPHRVQKTHKQVPHIFCDPRSKKNLVRSKRHVQVRKKGPQVQKTCIPTKNNA